MESTLTTQEITRVQTLQRLLGGYLTQRAAACELGLSVRHIYGLLRRRRDGRVSAHWPRSLRGQCAYRGSKGSQRSSRPPPAQS